MSPSYATEISKAEHQIAIVDPIQDILGSQTIFEIDLVNDTGVALSDIQFICLCNEVNTQHDAATINIANFNVDERTTEQWIVTNPFVAPANIKNNKALFFRGSAKLENGDSGDIELMNRPKRLDLEQQQL
ncbi:hypothetical protein AADZ86_14575 [Colwelliaceae bacterium BS250]